MAKLKVTWGEGGRTQAGETEDGRYWLHVERVRSGKRAGGDKFTEYRVQAIDRVTGNKKSKTVFAKAKAEAKALIDELKADEPLIERKLKNRLLH